VADLLVDQDGAIAILTINRPDAGNSLTPALIDQLGEELARLRDDDGIAVIVITGSGERAFCGGTDLRGAADGTAPADQFGVPPLHLARGMELWKPVIAAVNGYALGGGFELALACDLRYAASTATFGLPEVTIGSLPGAGGTQRIIRQAPYALAMEMLLLGERWDAHAVYRAGLVNEVCEPAQLMGRALDVAGRIARNAPLSVRAIKQVVAHGQHLELGDALRLERTLFNLLRGTDDRKEGRAAFAEKRLPSFRGR